MEKIHSRCCECLTLWTGLASRQPLTVLRSTPKALMQGAEPDLGRDCGWGITYRRARVPQSAGQGAKRLECVRLAALFDGEAVAVSEKIRLGGFPALFAGIVPVRMI